MSKPNARLPLFLFLLGTLAFSLSTLPHAVKGETTIHVASFSSEFAFATDCNAMGDSINGGANSGNCKFTGNSDSARVSAQVDVKLVKLPSRDPKDFDKVVTTEQWQITMKILCEGKNCPEDSGLTETTPVDKEDYRSITAKVNQQFSALAAKEAAKLKLAQEAAAKEKIRLAKVQNCEIDENGEAIEGGARISCRVTKLDGMSEDKAAEYYEAKILPDLEKLVGSDNVRDQKKGADLLKKLQASGAGGDFVYTSLSDLSQFGTYNLHANQLKAQLTGMPVTDSRYAGLRTAMLQEKFKADSFFHDRSDLRSQQDWTMGSANYDYSNFLTNNLADYQTQIDQNYAALLNQRQAMLNPSGAQVQPGSAASQVNLAQQNTDPRALRAPITALPAANLPASAWPAATTGAQPSTLQAMPAAAAAPVAGQQLLSKAAATPSGIPHSGTPVR